MSTPKILIPQHVPSVFRLAEHESNWLIFAIGAPDEHGKRPKRPVASDKPYIATNRDKAACMTLPRALKRLREFAELYTIETLSRKYEERRQASDKPMLPFTFEGFALGYLAREGSALVALDFDNAVAWGLIEDPELAALIEETPAYAEVSSSGTGLRVVMPRAAGDEAYGRKGEANNVGLFVSDRAGFAITFNTLRDGAGRDDTLFGEVVFRLQAEARKDGERGQAEDVAEAVLEHGRIEAATFIERVIPLVENDQRFDDFSSWFKMIRGPREYYETVDPDRLDDVKAALEAWCISWKGGEHDAAKFEDVWGRSTSGAGVGMGSWIHYAREAGFSWEEEPGEELPEDEWAFLKDLDTEKIGAGKTQITRPIANYMNAVRIVQTMPAIKDLVGRNMLTGGLLRLREWGSEALLPYPVEWTDPDMHRLIQTVQGARKAGKPVFAHFYLDQIKQAIEGGARSVQPIRDMLRRLPKWDGRPRIDTWLSEFFGVSDTPLHRAYARKFMISLVARGHAMRGAPVKVDTVLVLSGRQGMNKSAFFRILAGDGSCFTDHVGEITRKESGENIAGRWIVELSEGEIVSKADRRALKGFLAREEDKYRPSYGRNVQTFPRACVFVMPTNDEEVLNDPTGSRRYWPVTATRKAPLSALKAERVQLLAEARAAYDAGEAWWLTEEEDRAREDEAEGFEIEEPIAEALERILSDVVTGQIISQTDILIGIGVDAAGRGNSGAARTVRDLLRKWGWERAKSGARRGFRRGSRDTRPKMSEAAVKALKKGEVVLLPMTPEFERVEGQ